MVGSSRTPCRYTHGKQFRLPRVIPLISITIVVVSIVSIPSALLFPPFHTSPLTSPFLVYTIPIFFIIPFSLSLSKWVLGWLASWSAMLRPAHRVIISFNYFGENSERVDVIVLYHNTSAHGEI
ncbi:hypothetical protein Tco_0088723 [Tanacetum coccineum]